MVRMLGVVEGNMLSDEGCLRRAADMVCRVQPRADAACCDDKPAVMEGMSCGLNGDWRGMCCIMLIVFSPMMLMILLPGEKTFSYKYIHAYIYACTYIHTYTFIHTSIHTYIHASNTTYKQQTYNYIQRIDNMHTLSPMCISFSTMAATVASVSRLGRPYRYEYLR